MGYPAPGATDGTSPEIALRLMATTDVHMHILPFDYARRLPSVTTGLARTASLIRAARAEADNAMLFDNGDFLHGNPVGDEIVASVLKGRRAQSGRHPIIAAMASLGVDAITLGNHDFDHGADFLGHVLRGARFPVVTSNLTLTPRFNGAGPGLAPATRPFALLRREFLDKAGARHGICVGVIGLLPPGSITGLDGTPFKAECRGIAETARTMVPHLRALGADIVVALAHSGIGPGEDAPGLENAIVPLAAVPGIDAIIGGHAHQIFPDPNADWPAPVDPEAGTVHGTPVVIPGFWGSHLGVIDLRLKQNEAGRWSVAAAQAGVRPITTSEPNTGALRPTVPPDPKILRLLDRLHLKMVSRSRRPFGDTRRRLSSHFAAVGPVTALDVVHRAQAWWAARQLAGTDLAALPILSSAAPFKAGGLAGPGYYTDIAPGPVTGADLTDLYLFPNALCGLRLTGAELLDWLERAASTFNTLVPNRGDQPLISSHTPIYGFETVAGCDYRIDLTAGPRYGPNGGLVDASAHRVRDVSIGGRPVGVDDSVLLLTSSYRLSGGGGYPLPGAERVVFEPSVGVREIVGEYLAEVGPYDLEPWACWRFTPVEGASALFLSAPEADLRAAGLAGGIEPLDIRPDGFRLYRLALDAAVSYMPAREVGAGRRLANPVRSGRKQP